MDGKTEYLKTQKDKKKIEKVKSARKDEIEKTRRKRR